MAKKKSRRSRARKTPPGTRKRKISADEVKRAARLLADQSDGLKALLAQMQQHGLKEIEIDGQGLLMRGIDTIDRYIDNVDAGIRKARRDKERTSL